MIEKSSFASYTDAYFSPLVLRHAERTSEREEYLYRKMLTESYSLTGRWDNLTTFNHRVMADVVSLDSKLPLKSRPSIRKVSGDISKLGTMRKLNEKEISQIQQLIDAKTDTNLVVRELMKDIPAVMNGVYDRLEYMFLQGLSSGYTSTVDEDNVGTSIRVDFGYFEENKKTSAKPWSDAEASPLSDIEDLIEKARLSGHVIKFVYMDTKTKRTFLRSSEVRAYVAGANGVYVDGSKVPVPTLNAFNALGLGWEIREISVNLRAERDGVSTVVSPWEDGKVILTTSDRVGSLVWSKVAEMTHQAQNVNYQVSDNYMLVSQWRAVNPLSEFTAAQAMVFPVITGVESIYQLDTLGSTSGKSGKGSKKTEGTSSPGQGGSL